MGLVQPTGKGNETFMNLLKASLEIHGREVLRYGEGLHMLLRQFDLLLQIQHIAFVLLDQLDEVLQWQSILKLESGRRVVRSLSHIRLLYNVGSFGP